jgi:hypothetical protein
VVAQYQASTGILKQNKIKKGLTISHLAAAHSYLQAAQIGSAKGHSPCTTSAFPAATTWDKKIITFDWRRLAIVWFGIQRRVTSLGRLQAKRMLNGGQITS